MEQSNTESTLVRIEKLPAEIRLLIQEYALVPGRIFCHENPNEHGCPGLVLSSTANFLRFLSENRFVFINDTDVDPKRDRKVMTTILFWFGQAVKNVEFVVDFQKVTVEESAKGLWMFMNKVTYHRGWRPVGYLWRRFIHLLDPSEVLTVTLDFAKCQSTSGMFLRKEFAEKLQLTKSRLPTQFIVHADTGDHADEVLEILKHKNPRWQKMTDVRGLEFTTST
ncbi:hypothetical protein MMC20_003887 [Loxospora ochrophaea]|nr:hypothetical protein [Loxospora ochrophaea]